MRETIPFEIIIVLIWLVGIFTGMLIFDLCNRVNRLKGKLK